MTSNEKENIIFTLEEDNNVENENEGTHQRPCFCQGKNICVF